MKTITTGSDFSGVGAFDYAIERASRTKGFKHKRIFACDMDKFARQSYIANHGTPEYYPENVYDRTIPSEPLDIYMTSPPCQSFSIAGKRKGKNDDRGVLFFNSYEFIKKNQPRFFIFENVKGLLSDDKGRTFQEWINYLGGKSINGLPMLFKDDNAVEYHVYWKVLNTKKYGVPQNRKRVFIIGIRDDIDNIFQFPRLEHLTKSVKYVLENGVHSKYFLNDVDVQSILLNTDYELLKNKGFLIADYRTDEGLRIRKDDCSPCLQAVMTDSFNAKSGRNPPLILEFVSGKPRIRRLTPRECFRLQDFPESFRFVVSDSKLYKQAGNSITVRVLELILNKLERL